MQKIKNALKLSDRTKFQVLYQAHNEWPPLIDSIHLLELAETQKQSDRETLEQWAQDMDPPPFTLSQFEADWSVLTKDNIGIPYAIMSETEDWTLRPDCNGTTYLMKAAQVKDDELLRRLLTNCSVAMELEKNSNLSKIQSMLLKKDKQGLSALDYAVIAGGDLWPVREFLQWVDVEEISKSLVHASRSF
jgi:hypothetical protein